MRQSQQKSRGRNNRNNNNNNNGRKPQNPLNRNYESNGPDVKIRGNAAHIAEKYASLARDAQSSGDTVMAENYFQHAEHYNRIIMTAQAAQEARQDRRHVPQPNIEGDEETSDSSEVVSNEQQEEVQARNERHERHERHDRREGRRPRVRRNSPEEQSDAGDGANEEEVAADVQAQESVEKPAARRRPRAKSADAVESAEATEGKEGTAGTAGTEEISAEKPKKTTRRPRKVAAAITEDAAMLPESITGGTS